MPQRTAVQSGWEQGEDAMRRFTLALLASLAGLTLASCMSIAIGFFYVAYAVSFWWDKYISAAEPVGAVMVPARVAPGQSALLDFTLPAGLGGDGAVPLVLELQATAGEALPLLPEVYTPGGALPTPEAARMALAARYPACVPGSGAPGAWPAQDALRPGGHLPVLYTVPAIRSQPAVLLYLPPRSASAALNPGAGGSGGTGAPGLAAGLVPGNGGTDVTGHPSGDAAQGSDDPPLSPAGWPALCRVVLRTE
jgi:hypothetical protein